MHLPQTLLACALAATLSAQTTWIVDQSGGPGTNFTEIQAAVAAASSGDVILVRPGSYSSFSVGKGVRILGQPSFGVSFLFGGSAVNPLRVAELPANETLVIANATLSGTALFAVPPTFSYVSVQNASGHVHLQNVRFESVIANTTGPIGLQVANSADVTVSDCTFVQTTATVFVPPLSVLPVPVGYDPAVSVSQSDVTFVGCTILGRDAGRAGSGLGAYNVLHGPALVAVSSTVHLSRSDLVGGRAFSSSEAAEPAIIASESSVTITGLASNVVHAGPSAFSLGAPAISADGGSTVAVDTQLSVQGSAGGPPFAGGGTFVPRRIVTLDASGGALGGTLIVDAVSPEDDVCLLLLGLPYPPTPSPIGTLRINLATAVLLAQQVVPASGVTEATINIPNAVVLRGLLLGFQAANWDQTTGQFEVSNVADLVLQ